MGLPLQSFLVKKMPQHVPRSSISRLSSTLEIHPLDPPEQVT